MKINTNTLISDIVSENYNTATVFKKYGIDFCCNGNRTIQDVSTQNGLNTKRLMSEILEIDNGQSTQLNYQDWELGFLCDYIYHNHHLYVEKQSSEIVLHLDKICKVHGDKHIELFEISNLFKDAVADLAAHMKKEELILFPYIKKIANASKHKEKLNPPPFGSIDNPINMLHTEHDNEGERFRKISKLSNNYTVPDDGCSTYKIAYALLKEFEEDLHKHIHIENNILFKKAIELEKQINN